MDTNTGNTIQIVANPDRAAQLQAQQNITDKAVIVDASATSVPKAEPVAKIPLPNCRRCHGRGHLGKDLKTGNYMKCVCVLTDDEAKARRARIAAEELHHRRFGQK